MNARNTVKKLVPSSVFKAVEPTGHWAEAVVSQNRSRFPGKGMKIIGVTGTDGKTTNSSLIAQMLRNSGLKVALITTISVDYGDGKGEQPNSTRMTTMGAKELMVILKQIKTNKVDWVVMEITSHALAQHRVWGVPLSIGVMTNVGHEHLDYHGTFERYRDAKKMLFTQVNRNKQGLRVGIANADDPSGVLFASEVKNPVLYGIEKGDLRATNIKTSPSGSNYVAVVDDQEYSITCHLPGSFNIYNSLATVGVGRAIGLTKQQIEAGISSLESVEGRMTRIDEGQDYEVIVDYAHTPESFEKLFKEIKPITKGRLISVFGSAGRRDEAKRARQGEIAGKYCDIVVITEEDDRDADGQQILDQIAGGAEKSGKTLNTDLFKIHKREDAVAKAISLAKTGDVVLLLGKGHEKSILTNGPDAAKHRGELQNDDDPKRVVKRDYDEVLVAKKILTKQEK